MVLRFENTKDIFSFVKLALYKTDAGVQTKLLKWKTNDELTVNEDGSYDLNLSIDSAVDKQFMSILSQKFTVWKSSNKQKVLN